MMDPVSPVNAAAIAAATVLAIANIDAPTELGLIAGATAGELRLCYQAVAGANEWTLYAWDSASSTGASSPYRVNGTSGQWQAVAGKYQNGITIRNGLLTLGAGLTVSAGATSLQALTAASITNSSLTSGRIPVAGTAGLLGDFSALTYNNGTGQLTVGTLISRQVQNDRLSLCGGTTEGTDARVAAFGSTHATLPNRVYIDATQCIWRTADFATTLATLTSSSLTVSAATTAVQALTATTGSFSGVCTFLTTPVSNRSQNDSSSRGHFSITRGDGTGTGGSIFSEGNAANGVAAWGFSLGTEVARFTATAVTLSTSVTSGLTIAATSGTTLTVSSTSATSFAFAGGGTVAGSATIGGILSVGTGSGGGAGTLKLYGGTTQDRTWMEFYPDKDSVGTRYGYFGYTIAAGDDLALVNERTDAEIYIVTAGVGEVHFQPGGTTRARVTTSAISMSSGIVLQANGAQVVSARKTGWATATGTATRTTFDTTTVTLAQLAERVKALVDDLHNTAGHGLIGT